MFIGKYLRKRRRDFDRRVIFPKLKALAEGNEEIYLLLITSHVQTDPSWRFKEEWEQENLITGISFYPHKET